MTWFMTIVSVRIYYIESIRSKSNYLLCASESRIFQFWQITSFPFIPKKYNKDIRKASEPLIKRMSKYHWPGNIRELQHSIERAVIMSNHSVLQPEDLFLQKMAQPDQKEESVSLEHLNIEDVERILIRKALQKHNGHITRAADELGLTRSSLYRRLEKYGL